MQSIPFRALEKVIAREREVFERPLDDAEVDTPDGRRFIIKCHGLDVRARWNRGMELQVGQRTWRRRSYPARPAGLPERQWRTRLVADAIRAPNTVGRLLPGPRPGSARLYGLVDPRRFQPTDKRAVRRAFLRALRDVGIPTSEPRFDVRGEAPAEHYVLPVELLADASGRDDGQPHAPAVETSGPATRADIRLRYGLDTGCSGYWLTLSDVTVFVCSNGLVIDHRADRARLLWRHVEGEPVEEFLASAVPAVLRSYAALEARIAAARSLPAEVAAVDLAMAALPRAMDDEERADILTCVAQREQVEVSRLGPTRWAASQALSWVGTHEVRGLDGWRLREAAARALQPAA